MPAHGEPDHHRDEGVLASCARSADAPVSCGRGAGWKDSAPLQLLGISPRWPCCAPVASHAIQLPRLIGYTSRLLDPDRGRRSGGDLRRTCYRDTSDEAPRSRLGETLASSNRTRASADEAGEYG